MDFPFHYEAAVADGWTLPGIDGHLTIERNEYELGPGAEIPDWVATEVHVEAFKRQPDGTIAREVIELPEGHVLWERIICAVLSKHRLDIEARWDAEMRRAIGAAKARFAPRPVLVPANETQ